MKKVILLVMALAITTTLLNAQTSQGTIMVGGNASVSFETLETEIDGNTTSESDNSAFSLNPSVGYFFIDKFVAGLGLNIGRSKTESGSIETTNNSISIGPFARYYLENGVFFLGNVSFGSSKLESDSFENDLSFSQWRAGAGYAIFLNEWVAIEPTITYGSATQKNKDQDPEPKFIRRGLLLSVGFNIFLH